ncbi:MAG: hypothetical protein EXS17_07275 [Phycisphaerales bacterium]|nr:hypothetical protein [Phycisphaerales bacterium]
MLAFPSGLPSGSGVSSPGPDPAAPPPGPVPAPSVPPGCPPPPLIFDRPCFSSGESDESASLPHHEKKSNIPKINAIDGRALVRYDFGQGRIGSIGCSIGCPWASGEEVIG